MMKNPRVSIVIACWNSGVYLPRCLDSLVAQTFRDFEVIVVDNGSTDGSLNSLEANESSLQIRVERLSKNIGFAAANNIGARLAGGKWLVLLNADAFPEPDWIRQGSMVSRRKRSSAHALQIGHLMLRKGLASLRMN
jgi:GT2 family glycosyltransferase